MYLGTPEPVWASRGYGVPWFISRNRMVHRERGCRNLPTFVDPWAYDSGGFFVLREHRTWPITVRQYVADAIRHAEWAGRWPDWFATMDMMCEPDMMARTGLTVDDHQDVSTVNYVEAVRVWPEELERAGLNPETPHRWVPVVQGWKADHYPTAVEKLRAAEEAAGIAPARVVGIGSVCRREDSEEIGDVVTAVREAIGTETALHAFGVKSGGLGRYGPLVDSCDSQAWSYGARKRDVRTQYGLDCEHRSAKCTWCPTWALNWYRRTLGHERVTTD